jgi:hypothetical protein
MNYLEENKSWLFDGIGATLIIILLTLIFKKIFPTKKSDSTSENPSKIENKIEITNIQNTSLNKTKDAVINTDANDKNKQSTRILFIDDNHNEFRMVSILKKSGWINTKAIKDVNGLEDPKIIEANIIFVDINGVGLNMQFEDQGLGLASALKKKYHSKKIVIYSAETTGNRFHNALREVDACLSKNAEPYEFINLIEKLS